MHFIDGRQKLGTVSIVDVNLKLFADDAKLSSTFLFNFNSSSDLMTACHNLTQWAETWQLQIASEKMFRA